MARLNLVQNNEATGKAHELLEGVQKSLGMTPNLMKVLANAPSALDAYLHTNRTLAGGLLSATDRERISLRVGELNRCQYCVSAHTLLGSKAGLSEEEVQSSRAGHSADARADAVLTLATGVVKKQGRISGAELAAARDAGLSDGEILEVVANVALNILTNYTNNVAGTDIDFPQVELLAAVAN